MFSSAVFAKWEARVDLFMPRDRKNGPWKRVDSDQTPHSAASDQNLYCLH